MKKSKLIMISSFALAMVASLVMAFAMMNVTKAEPVSVSAEGEKTIYVYIDSNAASNKEHVKIHYWNSSDVHLYPGTNWTDRPDMNYDSGNDMYYYTLPSTTAGFLITFKNDWQTSNVTENIADGSVFAVTTGDTNVAHYIGDYTGTTTYYYYNTNWANAYAHVFNNTYSFVDTVWHGVAMSPVAGHSGWYSADIKNYYSGVTFNDGVSQQIDNTNLNSSNPYYNGYVWANTYIDPAKYYIVGTANGGWDLSSSSVLMNATTAGTDQAMKVYSATKDNQFRVRKGDGTWSDSQSINVGIGVDITIVGGEGEDKYNIIPSATKDYVVTVDNTGKTWVANYLGGINNKVSKNNDYFLWMTGFDLEKYSGADSIGYIYKKNTGDWANTFDNVYYTGVSINTDGGDKIVDYSKLGYAEGYKLIVFEASGCAVDDTFLVQAQIKNASGYVIASSAVLSATI